MNRHFYVEHAGMLADGLRDVGTSQDDYTPLNTKRIEGLAGAVIGQGLFNISRKEKNLDLIYYGSEHHNPFVRRCSALALGLAYLGDDISANTDLLARLADDGDIDVKRTALISAGIASLGKGGSDVISILNPNLEHPNWKVRSAAGLGYSFAFLGNDEPFDRIVGLLQREDSPYVKVCSCWYVSLSHAKKGEVGKFVDLIKDGDSFFRDMATLGIGFSHLGMGNDAVREYLSDIATEDEHPYVRESSYFGLGLNDFRNPNDRFAALVSRGLSDSSHITRSGASLSLGLVHFRRGNLKLEDLLDGESDASVLWGASLSGGLSGDSALVDAPSSYVAWANALSNAFRNTGKGVKETSFEDINIFQRNVNEGLMKSGIQEGNKDALRLLYPGVFYYIVYESFWWGLWMLSSLGATLWNDKNGEKR